MTEMQVISGTGLPVGWKHIPLKHNLRRLSEKSKKGGKVVALENIESWTGRAIETESFFDGDGVDFRKGDILFGKLRPYLAKVYLAESAGEAVGDLWALRPQDHIEPRFAAYQLLEPGFIDRVNGSTTGAKMPRAEWGFVGSIKVPTPPIEEQNAIVSFLDLETGRIDGLIEKKTRFITLLKEKRAAVITHAVTKGIDPDAPMKDSGQDWLDRVPAHWEVIAAARLFVERDERSKTGDEELLTVSHLTGVTPRSEKTVHMIEAESTIGYKRCLPGDLVVNTLWAWMGAMGTAPILGIASPAYNVYTPKSKLIDPRYIDYMVRLQIFAKEVTRFSKGVWSSRLRLYPEGLREVRFPVPPLDEQTRIADHLDIETARIDGLISLTERSIDLLREKRAALITASVTGKIDVRAAA